MNVKHAPKPTLKKINLHPFFNETRWATDIGSYAQLNQSFVFATLLLQGANQYFASFLPHTDEQVEGQHTILRLKHATAAEETVASNLLREVAESTRWRLEPRLWQSQHRATSGISCISHPHPPDHLRFDETPEEVKASDQQAHDEGRLRRQLTITIADEFVQVLSHYEAGTQEHLTISFMVAITILGEIARAVYLTDFDRSTTIVPYIGTDRIASFQQSFVAWLFGGWYPEPINPNSHVLADSGLCWVRQPTTDTPRRYFITKYSMDVDYLGRVMSQRAWDEMSSRQQKNHASVVDRLLRPRLPFRPGHTARTAIDDYESPNGVKQWKTQQRGDEHHQFPEDIPPYHDPDWDPVVNPAVNVNVTVWHAPSTEGFELDGTSIGRRNAKPPANWIREELVAAGALGSPLLQ